MSGPCVTLSRGSDFSNAVAVMKYIVDVNDVCIWKQRRMNEPEELKLKKTRLLIVGGGRVNGESMFPGPRNGETLGEL